MPAFTRCLRALDSRDKGGMSDHGPEEPFEPEREDASPASERREEDEEPDRDEAERTPETARNPWAKTSSGDADEL
jgi:hypothetical protein